MRRFYWPTATKAKAINRARQEKLTNEGQAMKEGLEYEKMFISQQGFNNIIERLKFATLRLVVPTTPPLSHQKGRRCT
jgi:predicted glycosyltransferase